MRPESAAEFGGLRIGDELTKVGGIVLDGMSDEDILEMIKQAMPTLTLEVKRMLPASELMLSGGGTELTIEEEDVFDGNVHIAGNRLRFDGLFPPSPATDTSPHPDLVDLGLSVPASTTAALPVMATVDVVSSLGPGAQSIDDTQQLLKPAGAPEDSLGTQSGVSPEAWTTGAAAEALAFLELLDARGTQNTVTSPPVTTTANDSPPAADEPSRELADSRFIQMLKERIAVLEQEAADRDASIAELTESRSKLQDELRAMLQLHDNGCSISTAPSATSDTDQSTASSLASLLIKRSQGAVDELTTATEVAARVKNLVARAVEAGVALQFAADSQARLVVRTNNSGQSCTSWRQRKRN